MDPGLTAEPYRTSDKNSFAYVSARDRWPVILTQAVDDVFRHGRDSADSSHTQEGSRIVAQIAQLKFELQHDRHITPLEEDGGDDIKGYNEELEKLGNPKWFNAPWLFAECYLYRRLNTFFTNSETWKTHDVFHVQKANAFKSSRAAVLELASQYRQIVSSLKNSEQPPSTEGATEGEKDLFADMSEICLWGNATDLSLLTSLTYADIQQLQGEKARKISKKHILHNQVEAVYDLLKKQRDGGKVGRIDIVLDNSGFELFVDLIFGGYLLAAGFATEIIFHPKSLPWFVSDVLPGDFSDLINALRDPVPYFGSPGNNKYSADNKVQETPLSDSQKSDLEFLSSAWSKLHAEGKFLLRPNRFWTTAASYWRLPSVAPQLLEDLKQSELVIFKGDLNYRKLTADAAWDPTTSFSEAIGELGKAGSGVRVLALRTCKADVVVGLGEGKDAELRSGDPEESKRRWAWSGKWAVIQFWDGKLQGESFDA